jgi:hypothetical protein
MTANPFRNVLTTFDLLPDEMKPYLLPNVLFDWSDLEHNANPIEHVAPTSREEAISYLDEWHYENPSTRPDLDRILLVDLANCFDRISPLLPPDDETTFAGEHVASGQYLAIDECDFPDTDDNPDLSDYTITLVFIDPTWEPSPIAAPDGLNSDDNPYITHTFHLINHSITE